LDLSFTYQEFSLYANMAKFVGLRVLPPLGVAQESSTNFPKLDLAALLNKVEDTRRHGDGTYARDLFEWTTDSYALTEHGVEEVVDDATIEIWGDVIRAENIHARRAIHRVLQRLEYDISQAVFDTATWTGAALTTDVAAGDAEPWTVHASGTPHADIMAAHQKVEDGTGFQANALLVPSKAWRNLLQCDEITSLVKYDAFRILEEAYRAKDAVAVRQVMAGLNALFQVDDIIIARSFQNTADEGQTASLSPLWDATMAMLCTVSSEGPNGDSELEPCIGRTLFSTKNNAPIPGDDSSGAGSLILEEYREEQRRGGVLRPRNKRQVKVLHAEAGHLLQGVTA